MTPSHQLERIDEERDFDTGQTRWRWVCRCRTLRGHKLRRGQWNWQSENVAKFAWERHTRAVPR